MTLSRSAASIARLAADAASTADLAPVAVIAPTPGRASRPELPLC